MSIRVKDWIDYHEAGQKLMAVLPATNAEKLGDEIEAYFKDTCLYENVVYTVDQARDLVNELLATFVAEQQGETLLVAKTAIQCQMPLVPIPDLDY